MAYGRRVSARCLSGAHKRCTGNCYLNGITKCKCSCHKERENGWNNAAAAHAEQPNS